MQMLLYLAALYENGGKRYKIPSPAGVLYMPAAVPAAPADRGTPKEKQMKKQEAELRMSGLVRDDPAIVAATDLIVPIAHKVVECQTERAVRLPGQSWNLSLLM